MQATQPQITDRGDVGDLDIILPPDVDVALDVSVDVGNAQVLGQH